MHIKENHQDMTRIECCSIFRWNIIALVIQRESKERSAVSQFIANRIWYNGRYNKSRTSQSILIVQQTGTDLSLESSIELYNRCHLNVIDLFSVVSIMVQLLRKLLLLLHLPHHEQLVSFIILWRMLITIKHAILAYPYLIDFWFVLWDCPIST
jgi:hypothetical protein